LLHWIGRKLLLQARGTCKMHYEAKINSLLAFSEWIGHVIIHKENISYLYRVWDDKFLIFTIFTHDFEPN
jgi:hypothetical protein